MTRMILKRIKVDKLNIGVTTLHLSAFIFKQIVECLRESNSTLLIAMIKLKDKVKIVLCIKYTDCLSKLKKRHNYNYSLFSRHS